MMDLTYQRPLHTLQTHSASQQGLRYPLDLQTTRDMRALAGESCHQNALKNDVSLKQLPHRPQTIIQH